MSEELQPVVLDLPVPLSELIHLDRYGDDYEDMCEDCE